jgi:hypothetical protein
MRAQGWYRDPYRRHGERWISDGRPTSLVRDHGAESFDAPPPGEPPVPARGWLAVPEHPAPWPAPEAARVEVRRQAGRTFAIVAGVIGQVVIWAAIYVALGYWAYSQAWPPGGG